MTAKSRAARIGSVVLAERQHGDGSRAMVDCEVVAREGKRALEMRYLVVFLHGDACGAEEWLPAASISGKAASHVAQCGLLAQCTVFWHPRLH